MTCWTCEGEWEALLTENRLIKDTRPRFNVRLMDDKTFPYLAITMREDFPRVFVTRNLSDPLLLKGAKIFGPFVAAGALREAVQLLQRVFKFRTCSLDIEAATRRTRSSGRASCTTSTSAPRRAGKMIGVEPYRADVDRFIRFLESKRSVMLREMRTEMEAAAADMKFEKAAALRDQIRAIERLGERANARDGWQPETENVIIEPDKALKSLQKTLVQHGMPEDGVIRCIEGIDIAHLQGEGDGGEQGVLHRRAAVQERVPAVQESRA